jgi:hypothetical protein
MISAFGTGNFVGGMKDVGTAVVGAAVVGGGVVAGQVTFAAWNCCNETQNTSVGVGSAFGNVVVPAKSDGFNDLNLSSNACADFGPAFAISSLVEDLKSTVADTNFVVG